MCITFCPVLIENVPVLIFYVFWWIVSWVQKEEERTGMTFSFIDWKWLNNIFITENLTRSMRRMDLLCCAYIVVRVVSHFKSWYMIVFMFRVGLDSNDISSVFLQSTFAWDEGTHFFVFVHVFALTCCVVCVCVCVCVKWTLKLRLIETIMNLKKFSVLDCPNSVTITSSVVENLGCPGHIFSNEDVITTSSFCWCETWRPCTCIFNEDVIITSSLVRNPVGPGHVFSNEDLTVWI